MEQQEHFLRNFHPRPTGCKAPKISWRRGDRLTDDSLEAPLLSRAEAPQGRSARRPMVRPLSFVPDRAIDRGSLPVHVHQQLPTDESSCTVDGPPRAGHTAERPCGASALRAVHVHQQLPTDESSCTADGPPRAEQTAERPFGASALRAISSPWGGSLNFGLMTRDTLHVGSVEALTQRRKTCRTAAEPTPRLVS